jgi:transposase-like protein
LTGWFNFLPVQLEVLMAGCSDLKVRQWERRMSRFDKSSLSVARFCHSEGVSAASFYQWRKRLQQPAALSAEAKGPAVFTPVRLVGSASVSVHLPGGTQVDIPTADPQILQLAIQTLADADAQRIAGGAPC